MRRGVVVVVLAGCFSKPGLAPGDGGGSDGGECTIAPSSTPGMSFDPASGVALWPQGMRLVFPDSQLRVPQPTELRFAGATNLIADPIGSPTDCGIEDRIGVAYYPLFTASAGGEGFGGLARQALVAGAAYVEISVRWGRQFTCAAASNMTGESRWGLFPDGRIVRIDDTVASSVDMNLDTCGQTCAGGDIYFLTSYIAFRRSALTSASFAPTMVEAPVPPPPGGAFDRGVCVTATSGGRIALRYDQFVGGTSRFRYRSIDTANELAIVADMEVINGPNAMLPTASRGVRTTLLMDPTNTTSCADLQAAAGVLTTSPPSLLLTSGARHDVSVNLHTSQQYMAQGDYESSVAVTTAGGTVRGGFLVSIQMPGTRISTSRDAAGVIWHHDPDGRFYVWFRDPLMDGQTITLTSGC